LALGFLATTERPDALTLTVPADLAPELSGALEVLRAASSGGAGVELDASRASLSGPRAALHELLAVAIDEAGERLGQRCTALLRGEASAADVRARLTTLTGLLDLLDRVTEEAEPGGGAAVDVDDLPRDERRGG
jgi:ribose 1,5-bisphosphokinase PhnN